MQYNGHLPTASRCAIDGVEPARTVEPTTPEAIADLLADAASSRLGVAPVGGATTLGLGNPIERYDIAMSTGQLRNILDYEPMDLVLSVEAGARFVDVQAVLGEHGQHLPVETPFPDRATIGGMIATARSGPRRLSSGSLRDLLIGMSVAHASGTVTKCGGMVVKNVSGYDLPRVYHGSLGTLGIITSANFKIVPLPRAERTIIGGLQLLDEAVATVGRLQQTGLPFVAVEMMSEGGKWRVAVRFEGRERSVETIAESAKHALADAPEELADTASRAWWQQYLDDQAADDGVIAVRSSVRPRDTLNLVRDIEAHIRGHNVADHRMWASPGMGTVSTRWSYSANDPAAIAKMVALHADLIGLANHTVVTAAPIDVKRRIDIWGAEPDTLDVMRELKHEFDPSRVLNPGRFAGRL